MLTKFDIYKSDSGGPIEEKRNQHKFMDGKVMLKKPHKFRNEQRITMHNYIKNLRNTQKIYSVICYEYSNRIKNMQFVIHFLLRLLQFEYAH